MILLALSVPSSSGNTLQQCSGELVRSRNKNFQSPLHRGILCNARRARPREFCGFLSVPSSSGNTLQHLWHVEHVARQHPFSPLFIGEYSATLLWVGQLLHQPTNLSVPSSSGNTLQPAGASTSATELVPFSPLFIGEYSATLNEADRVADRERPFSPLFIGEYSATM